MNYGYRKTGKKKADNSYIAACAGADTRRTALFDV
jgi:hypothetical protein